MGKIFDGIYIGNIGKIFGSESKIEIDKIDCWLNYSKNITLIIDGGEKKILCSSNLSELIRLEKLDEKTDELKKFSIYEFEDGIRYATHLIENSPIKAVDEKSENKDGVHELIVGVKKMYVTEVLSGYFINKGNFIALDKNKYEFFADKSFVEKNIKLCETLVSEEKPLWILVNNEIWGGKWNNKQVSRIETISENKDFCICFREKLVRIAELKIELVKFTKEKRNLIQNSFLSTNFEQQLKTIEKSEDELRKELQELKKQVN
ncbi:hypothetical protein [Flavobacterium granuli]|uniref:Uncharacterized protein n=1 Tax=Flavobacterium granuli TaxID=280093 RepID=A0ABU1S6Q1_9FLAO|nr:hypothetical protein [Flavobacterium granuli]MDR6846712.1 hypothetical protein [Flavobacterium granuli]